MKPPICESVKLPREKWRDYLLAGNAIFTLRSTETDKRFTFRSHKADARPDAPYFIATLTGPDNTTDFSFLGTLFAGGEYRHGRKSRITPDAPSAVAARWFVTRVYYSLSLTGVEMFHEGRCGRCGRRLTVPESIESGIGPECAKHHGS